MKKFTNISATTIDEAVSSLGEYGDKATVIAGGTDLIGELVYRNHPVQPEYIVDLKTIPDLDYINEDSTGLKIGALTRLDDIANSSTVQATYPALAQAARAVASWNIRVMGTIGGNLCQHVRCWYYRSSWNKFFCFRKGGTLCQAVPGDNRYNAILGGQVCFAICPSDTAIPLMALNATIVTSKRSIPIDDFFAVLGNVLDVDEIVTEVQVPTPPAGSKQAFAKATVRHAIDFALSSAAVVIAPSTGNVTSASIVLGAVAPTPWRATQAEEELVGNAVSEAVADSVAEAAVDGAFVLTSNSSSNAWKVQAAKGVVKRAILA
jgi:xanthine dehydrogenase YagS FAD-binding subunit